SVFLVGILPAVLVLWIRRAVPEPAEWQTAKDQAETRSPAFADLFQGPVRRTTIVALLVCATSLTAHWAFMFWVAQHLRSLSDVASWSDADKSCLASRGLAVLMVASICGNFLSAALARRVGYRLAIVTMFLSYFACMFLGYSTARAHDGMWVWLATIGA